MSSEDDKDGRGGGATGLGSRMPYRQLSSQIVSKDEIAEEIANRFSKSAADTTRPFVDKRVLQNALLALKFDTQFIRKIDPSNEEVLRPKPTAVAPPAEDELPLRFGQRIDPKLEKELALKQLSELPTVKRRRKQQANAEPEPEPNPVSQVFNERILQNLKRSVQRSARHSELVPGPDAVRSVLQKLEEATDEAYSRPQTSRIIRRHSSSEEEEDSDHEDDPRAAATQPDAPEAAATEKPPVADPTSESPEGRVMRSRVQRTYPSKRRPGGDAEEVGIAYARRTYPSPHARKQLS